MLAALINWLFGIRQEPVPPKLQYCPFCCSSYTSYHNCSSGKLKVKYTCGTKVKWQQECIHSYDRSKGCRLSGYTTRER